MAPSKTIPWRKDFFTPAFTPLLDQSFASGATAAYSLRRLKSTATKAVRVREDSGNTETDIGFSGGTLDETALLNHVGSNNAFVTKWYDQSGNSNDASQSTASEQPQIVSSGSVIKDNNRPTLKFGDRISLSTNIKLGYPVSVYVVANPLVKQSNINDLRFLFNQDVFNTGFACRFRSIGIESMTDDGNNISRETINFSKKQLFLSFLYNPTTSLVESQDNSKSFAQNATTIKGTATLDIASRGFGGRAADNPFYIQEEIFYNFDNIVERGKFRKNQQNFY